MIQRNLALSQRLQSLEHGLSLVRPSDVVSALAPGVAAMIQIDRRIVPVLVSGRARPVLTRTGPAEVSLAVPAAAQDSRIATTKPGAAFSHTTTSGTILKGTERRGHAQRFQPRLVGQAPATAAPSTLHNGASDHVRAEALKAQLPLAVRKRESRQIQHLQLMLGLGS
jgi:hypothetical protein